MIYAARICDEDGDASKSSERLNKRRLRKLMSRTIPCVFLTALLCYFYPTGPSHRSREGSIRLPPPPPPEVAQRYYLLERRQASPDTCFLRFSLPEGRSTLRSDNISLPTCIKVTMPGGTDVYGTGIPPSLKDLSKSYSPISVPSTLNTFDLIVKTYPARDGGGVGSFLCTLQPENIRIEDGSAGEASKELTSIVASVKKPRIMLGSPNIYKRWRHVGLVAGGTGIAPLFQIAAMLLKDSSGYTTDISLLSINRHREDILLKDELESMVKSSKGRFRTTFSLTSNTDERKDSDGIEHGRGSLDMVQKALPPPDRGDDATIILVCGTDGFVEYWGGPIGRGPPKPDGSKGPKIQGPLLGLLGRAGYKESEVFKY